MKKKPTIILLMFMLLALLVTACSPSAAEKLNKEGNEAFEKQAFEDALIDYQTAQIKEPELAEPYYNAANALYRQGQYEAALEQLNMALSFAEEETLTGHSFFNLGNSSFNMQDLGTAVAAYTESLLLNPDDQDAKYNLELALQQQQQQEQQEQQQQEQEQEQSEDGQEQEQPEGGDGEQEQEPQDQGQEQPEEGQEGEQDQQSEQPQDGQQGEEQEQDGQPQEGQQGENQQQEGQPSQVPAPGQRMTEEQAQQLLAAIAGDSQTLQEKLGQIFAVPWSPPAQDW